MYQYRTEFMSGGLQIYIFCRMMWCDICVLDKTGFYKKNRFEMPHSNNLGKIRTNYKCLFSFPWFIKTSFISIQWRQLDEILYFVTCQVIAVGHNASFTISSYSTCRQAVNKAVLNNVALCEHIKFHSTMHREGAFTE